LVGHGRPQKAAQLARHGDVGDRGALAVADQRSVAVVEPHLRLRGSGGHLTWDVALDSEVLDDERAATVTVFTRRALDWFLDYGIVAERILTDNAWTYTNNRGLAELLDRRQILHKRTRPYSPKTNGKDERYQQTLEREWEKGLAYNSSADRRDAPPHRLEHYNTRAPLRDRKPDADRACSQPPRAGQLDSAAGGCEAARRAASPQRPGSLAARLPGCRGPRPRRRGSASC
jgi:hypothetical protein